MQRDLQCFQFINHYTHDLSIECDSVGIGAAAPSGSTVHESREWQQRKCAQEPITVHYVCASVRGSQDLRITSVPVCVGAEI